jgi:dihydroxyacetone kinase
MHTAVLEALNENSISGNDVLGSVITISRIAEDAMGGTSGALYSSVKFLWI